jgi:hypothetical protein
LHRISFRPTCFEATSLTPAWVPDQLEFKSERFGIAIRLLCAYAFGRPQSEQNSSHAPGAPMSELSAQATAIPAMIGG